MKKVGFLIFCLFAMCSMAGKAQDVVADSTGYIVKVGEMAPDFTVKLTDGKSITGQRNNLRYFIFKHII